MDVPASLPDFPRYSFTLDLKANWQSVSPSFISLVGDVPADFYDIFQNPDRVREQLLFWISRQQDTLDYLDLEVTLRASQRVAQLLLYGHIDRILGYLTPESGPALQQRRILESQIKTLYGAAGPQMITILDTRARVVSFNQGANGAAIQRFGHPMFPGEPFQNYVQKDRIEDFENSFKEVLQGKTVEKEREIYAPDGKFIAYRITYAPIFDLAGKVQQIVFFATDLSEQKRMQKALQESEALLRQAQKMEAVGISASGIAHDFNNILTALTGYAELMAQEDLPTTARELNHALRFTCEKAQNLTRQLLMLSRKESAESSLVDLNTLLKAQRDLYQQIIGVNITLHYKLQEPARVFMNRTQVEQIVLNLLTNARDAMDTTGRIDVYTHTHRFSVSHEDEQFGTRPPGNYVCLEVQDTGPGIPEHVKPRIFEPFFTTKSKERGTGLGLTLIYRIVKEAEGWVNLESSEKGTRFQIFLPLYSAEAHTTYAPEAQVGLYKVSSLESERIFHALEDLQVTHCDTPDQILPHMLVISPFSAHHLADTVPARAWLYLAGEEDVESDAFDELKAFQDVLLLPYASGQLKHRIRTMLCV